jgi:type IV secretory pathway TrbD component
VIGAQNAWTYFGNANNQVFGFSTDKNTAIYKQTSIGIPLAAGIGGTVEFGNDGLYRALVDQLSVLVGGAWNTAAVLTGLFTFAKALGIAIAIGLPLGILVWAVLHIVEGWTEKRHIPWYAKPFIFMGNVIYSLGLYLLYYPIYFIVISVIWNFICVSLIYGAGKGLVVGFMKFGGLFGEYFSASYTDMCPGISWGDENKEKE